jgi:hypothetical protein
MKPKNVTDSTIELMASIRLLRDVAAEHGKCEQCPTVVEAQECVSFRLLQHEQAVRNDELAKAAALKEDSDKLAAIDQAQRKQAEAQRRKRNRAARAARRKVGHA